MKKFIPFLLCIMIAGSMQAQRSDTLIRASGLYLSPAMSDFHIDHPMKELNPQFAVSMGYRRINKIGNGFFIEGGVGFSTFRGTTAEEGRVWVEYVYGSSNIEHYYIVRDNITEFNWNTPFLVGYKTRTGKVRFQGAAGVAFSLRTWQLEETEVISGDAPSYYYYGYDYNSRPQLEARFGTSFFGVARAGISIPWGDKISVDILPTARYRIFHFTQGTYDVFESIETGDSPWSLGLDIGITIAMEDKAPEIMYEYIKPEDADYTLKYKDSSGMAPIQKRIVNNGYKNFVYMEMVGVGLAYSLNYERTFFSRGATSLQARGGFGFFGNKYAFPLGMNITTGGLHKKFEAGFTATMNNFTNGDFDDHSFNISIDPCIAYRIERENHVIIRLALMTHILPANGAILPGLGFSIGGGF